MLWVLLLLLIVSLTLLYKFWQMGASPNVKAVTVVACLVFMTLAAIELSNLTVTVPEVDYGVPDCPADGVTYHEQNVSWGTKESAYIDEYHARGWSNITTRIETKPGFFGGHVHIVSGECPQARPGSEAP